PDALRRGGELEVELEPAPVRRVDLGNRVGDPDRRHRIELERLVDPGLAVDRAGAAVLPAEQADELLADRREDVLDLVEQDGSARPPLEEGLGYLQGAIALAPGQAVAVGVQAIHLVELQPRESADQLGEFGLAGAGRAVEEDVDAPLLPGRRRAQQGDELTG